MFENLAQIVIGSAFVVVGALGKEFYPGRAGKKRGLLQLDPWMSWVIFVGFGTGLLLGGISKLLRH